MAISVRQALINDAALLSALNAEVQAVRDRASWRR
jgi:hypothetical protein